VFADGCDSKRVTLGLSRKVLVLKGCFSALWGENGFVNGGWSDGAGNASN